MHRSRLCTVTIDCRTDDLDAASAFWASVFGSDTRPGDGYVALDDQGALRIEVQRVEHPSRAHLDIETDDIPAEIARLERFGAKKVAEIKTWVVMEAPTGHRFCLIPAQTERFEAEANRWEG